MGYLIAYFGVGVFLVISSLKNGMHFQKKYFTVPIIVMLWPIIVMFAPEALYGPRRCEDIGVCPEEEPLMTELTETLIVDDGELLKEDLDHVKKVAKYGENNIWTFSRSANFREILSKYWDDGIPPEIYQAHKSALFHLSDDYDPDAYRTVRFSISGWQEGPSDGKGKFAVEWVVGFSREFVKSIAKVDRKKRGRILEAIEKIADAPMVLLGDTIKPLTQNHHGLWRFRIGDDRIVYFPDAKKKTVILICFACRGEAYENLPETIH